MLTASQIPMENDSPIDEALAWHDGDVRATIATLLEDCKFLREQLSLASHCISHGMTRGWLPKTERAE